MSPNKIVITGIIASGKSALADLIRKKGHVVISADEVNRELLEKGGANYLAIKASGAFDEAFDGESLNKKRLGEIIFANKEKRLLLNELTHPNILAEIDIQVEKSKAESVFIEMPLYFEVRDDFDADRVILVVADREVQIKRLMERDKIDYDYALSKIQSQKDLDFMKENSDMIIDNSHGFDKLEEEVDKLLSRGDF